MWQREMRWGDNQKKMRKGIETKGKKSKSIRDRHGERAEEKEQVVDRTLQ